VLPVRCLIAPAAGAAVCAVVKRVQEPAVFPPDALGPVRHALYTGACWQVLEDGGDEAGLHVATGVLSTQAGQEVQAQLGNVPAVVQPRKANLPSHTANMLAAIWHWRQPAQ
jgi:hypothetical protein